MTAAGDASGSSARVAVGCAFLVALLLAIPLVVGGPRAVVGAFQDDAYYYARIARNVARGDGITFDGIHATSGFHPLWLVVLVPIFSVWSETVPPLIAMAAVQIVLVSAAAGLMTAELARIVDRWTALAGGVVFVAIPATGSCLIGGLEGALTLFAVTVAWRLWLNAATTPGAVPSAWVGPGLAFALCGLARLEAFVFLPVALALGFRRMGKSAGAAAAFLAPGFVALIVVVGASRTLTSTWLPISGAVKAASRMARPEGRALPFALGAALAILAVGALIVRWRRARTDGPRSALLLPSIAATLWISADLIGVGTLEPWNRIPLLLLATVAVVGLASSGHAKLVASLVVLLAVARVPLAIARGAFPPSSYAPYRWEAGVWLRDHVDPADRIGSWNAGTIGYASDRQVVNLDGLVNDRAYFEEVIRGKALAAYLDREGIAWIADQACGIAPTPAPYLVRTGSQALAARITLVASFFDRTSSDGCPGVAIWRLTPR